MDKDFYIRLLDEISDGVYFVSRDRRITYWNGGAERITGYSADEVIGHSCSEGILRHVNEAGHQLCLHGCPLAGVMRDGKPRQAHVYLHHKDGHRVPVTIRGQALRAPDGSVIGSAEVFTSRVISPYAARERRRQVDYSLDPVTGLPLRRFGELQLRALLEAVRDGSASLGLLFLDADHFKAVNDKFGHRTGDDVLKMVGQSLANGLRSGDIPTRWGGEEFLALLPGVDRRGLASTAERIRMLVENSWITRGEQQVRVTVSIGATMAGPADTVADLVDRADRFMYASKAAGRNQVTVEGETMTSSAEAPILGMGIPWEMPDREDLDGWGSGQEDASSTVPS